MFSQLSLIFYLLGISVPTPKLIPLVLKYSFSECTHFPIGGSSGPYNFLYKNLFLGPLDPAIEGFKGIPKIKEVPYSVIKSADCFVIILNLKDDGNTKIHNETWFKEEIKDIPALKSLPVYVLQQTREPYSQNEDVNPNPGPYDVLSVYNKRWYQAPVVPSRPAPPPNAARNILNYLRLLVDRQRWRQTIAPEATM